MSTWNYNQEGDGGPGRFGWDGADGWGFDTLDEEELGTLEEEAYGDYGLNLPESPPSFTNTSTDRTAPPSRNNGSRAHDTSFLDDLLQATAPDRRRAQPASDPQIALTRARETLRSDPPATSNRHSQTNRRSGNSEESHFGYIPNSFFDIPDYNDATPQSTQSTTRRSSRDSGGFVTLDGDTDSEEGLANMPATRRGTNRRSSVVDLTSGASAPSQQRPRGRKRSADESASAEARAPKRGRTWADDIEEVDLSKEPPSAEEELLQQQQQETIKQQQQALEEDNGPLKIGKRTCIICMENFTNCTIASCGHFYCHECLIQALLAGEKNSDRGHGTCPQCRRPLTRNNKKKRDIIPLSFMKKETFEKNQRKRLQAS